MSQYYPQQNPYYPPQSNPEEDYIYEEGEYEAEGEEGGGSSDTLLQRILIFLAGGCLVFLCMACCGLFVAGLYFLDSGSFLASTPLPGSDLGLSSEEAANPDEAVVNDQQTQLMILEVNRNASLEKVPAAEGRELIIVTVELTNLSDKEKIDFNERDLLLLNAFEEAYQPLTGVIDDNDDPLGRGTLSPGEGLEGRLAFEVKDGERDLVLAWESKGGSRYIFLE